MVIRRREWGQAMLKSCSNSEITGARADGPPVNEPRNPEKCWAAKMAVASALSQRPTKR
jgi:hypothetical protein